MRASNFIWATAVALAATATASPMLNEDSLITARDVGDIDDPDCCGTGYSQPACVTTVSCDASGVVSCCPAVVEGVSEVQQAYERMSG